MVNEERVHVTELKDLQIGIEKLKQNGYNYIVKVKDNWLSGWGDSGPKGHVHLIAARNWKEVKEIMDDLKYRTAFSYANYENINNYTKIKNWTKNKSFSLRNDWICNKM